MKVVDETELGGRPAHVEGERVRAPALACDLGSEDRAGGGSGLDEPDGKARRDIEGGEAATRRHEEQRATDAEVAECRGEAGKVARHPGLDVGVGAGRD